MRVTRDDLVLLRAQARDAAHARSECDCEQCRLINWSCADAASGVWEQFVAASDTGTQS